MSGATKRLPVRQHKDLPCGKHTCHHVDMAPNTHSHQMLETLAQDRTRLRAQVKMPAWLAPTIGFLAATWIASPAVGDSTANSAYLFSVGGVVLAIYLATRAAGVRYGRLNAHAYVVIGAAGATGLALYSTSLGLVSVDLRWWVILPVLAMAVVGYLATHIVERESLAKVARGL